MNLQHIFVIAGPTGSGKSALAVEAALFLKAEIVSVDAFQVYRGLPVLTAQPDAGQLAAVQHHLVGILDPAEENSAVWYAGQARAAIEEIQGRGKVALLTGGAGFYYGALFGRSGTAPQPDPVLRAELAEVPLEELLRRLEEVDAEAARTVDRQNPRRVRRALEVVLMTGRPFASFAPKPTDLPPGWVLAREREELYCRIDLRAEEMLRSGAIEEVAALGEISPTCAQIIGLREIRELLDGKRSREETLAAIQLATRRYAKRQMTWFRHQTSWPEVRPGELMSRIRQVRQ